MIAHESLMTIAFRFINAGILVVLGVYIYKKYIQPAMRKEIEDRERFLKGLAEQKRALEYQQHEMEDRIESDKKLCASLRDRVMQWARKEQALKELREAQRVARIKELERITKMRADSIAIAHAQQQVLPLAVAHARQELEKKMSSDKAGALYLDNVIKMLTTDRS